MIVRTPELEALERRWERDARDQTFEEALARYSALWAEARALGQQPLADWRDDIQSTLDVARAVNGLPPA
jgi:hypothetical protein